MMRGMRRPAAILMTVIVCAPASAQRTSHERMVELLAERAVAAEQDNPFFGRRRASDLDAALQKAGAAALWQTRFDAGMAALRLGDERRGIGILQEAHDLLRDGALKADHAAIVGTCFQLGVAYLRLGETENCCARHNEDSCILPIAGGGLHDRKEGSTKAIACLLEVLNNTDRDDYWHHAARWLLNIAHMTLGTWPDGVPAAERLPATAFAAQTKFPRFFNVAPKVGLDTFGTAGGVAIDDFDGDGVLDVVVSDWAPRGQVRFFRRGADGRFEDRTVDAGLTGITGGLNVVHADYDNDGDLDLLVLRGAWWFEHGRLPCSLLQNDGRGRFTDVTFDAGLGERQFPTQVGAFADYDNDGDLDLFVGAESSARIRCASQLWRNEGNGKFVDVAAAAGVTNDAYCKGATWGDFDGDRWPDLFVSNFDGDNRLYRNRRDGTFEDVAAKAGVTGPRAAFGTWFWDFDDDGVLDLFVANYDTTIAHLASDLVGGSLRHDTLRIYRGDGKGGFEDVAKRFGLVQAAMPMGCNFGDLDNDGWLDFYLGTGDPEYASLMPNLMFRNAEGRGFEDVTISGGFGHLQKGHGVAFADLDDDGDLDVFEVVGGAYPGDAYHDMLYENPGFGNGHVVVRLVGTDSVRCAIGAQIRVVARAGAATRTIRRHVNTGGSFGSSPLRQTIGLGGADRIERIEIFWPKTGKTQVVEGVPIGASIVVTEGVDGFVNVPRSPRPFTSR